METCDAQTNTDQAAAQRFAHRLRADVIGRVAASTRSTLEQDAVDRASALRRSKTFSPSANAEADYICKVSSMTQLIVTGILNYIVLIVMLIN